MFAQAPPRATILTQERAPFRDSLHSPVRSSQYNALFIIPLLQANYILLAIINGGIFFDEFRGFKAGHWVIFSIGLMGIFVGLYLLRPSVEHDHAIDSAIAEHHETTLFIPEDVGTGSKLPSSKRRGSSSARRVSLGGIGEKNLVIRARQPRICMAH
jgi:hypothetical protein